MSSGPARQPEGKQERPRVQSVARAIGVLFAVAQSDNGLTTKEISEQVGIGRQATYHLLHTLTATGMLARAGHNRYVLGLQVGTLSEAFIRQLAPSEHLAPIVRELAQQTGETCYATGWLGGETAVLSVVQGTHPIHAGAVSQGHIGQAHARASGKLLLASAAPGIRAAYLDSHPLERMTPNTIVDPAELEAELERIREQGYAEDIEEYALDLCCMAASLGGSRSPFVLALSAPRDRYVEHREEYLATLLERAHAAGGLLLN